MTTSDRTAPEVFTGAQRARRYAEAPDQEPNEALGSVLDLRDPTEGVTGPAPAGGHDRGIAPLKRPAPAPRTPVTVPAATGVRPAQWGLRGRVGRLTGGLVKLAPESAELAHREALNTIRRATWTRAVNVIVTNPKGGSGKTPTALLLAGILGHVRGGYVAVWEAAESVGTLNQRAEGDPERGLAELLAGAGQVRSAGTLGGYTAPQTSHADVIGSVGGRAVLTAADVLSARTVLDTYYRITLTDTGNNPGHPAFQAALRTADAAVLPCLVSIDALAGLEEALAVMRGAGDDVSGAHGLLARVVVVLGHDGGPEDSHIATALRARLEELGVAAVVEVPFDPAIRLGGEITLAALSEKSTRAWTSAAAAVVEALSTAPTHTDLVQQLQVASNATRQG